MASPDHNPFGTAKDGDSAIAAAGWLGRTGQKYACYPSFSSLRWLMAAFISSVRLVFVVPDDELFVLSSFTTASGYDAITLKRDELKASFVKIYD